MILICFCISIAVALATFTLLKLPNVSPARASSIVSLFSFTMLFVAAKFVEFDVDYFSFLIFGASFIGMCSHKVFNLVDINFAAGLYTILYFNFFPLENGAGGALGFSAFVSILVVWLLSKSGLKISDNFSLKKSHR